MTRADERPTPEALAPLLTTRELGRPVRFLERTGSTSQVAFQLAQEGAGHGLAVIADEQTEGRGRRDRDWASPPGANLYLSLVLRPDLPPARAPELGLVAAVALCEALAETGCEARIKWPNDLQVDGLKVAGILCELASAGKAIDFVILGIGVNLNLQAEDLPSPLRQTATSARMATGRRVDRPRFCAALLGRLEGWLDRHRAGGFGPARARWMALSSTVGARVRVELESRRLVGEALGIDDDGALLVRAETGEVERVLAGDVERLRPHA